MGELKDIPYKITICGNHDRVMASRPLPRKIFTNSIYLENSSVEIEGIKFYGFPHTPTFRNLNPQFNGFMKNPGKDMYKACDRIPEDIDILISHGPPYGILDYNKYGERCGSVELLERVFTVKPKWFICGHIHESYGMLERDGIKFINCSLLDDDMSLTHLPVEVEL